MSGSRKKSFLIFIIAFLLMCREDISYARTFEEKIILIPPTEASQKASTPLEIVKDLIKAGDFSRAQELLNVAVEIEPNSSEIYSLNSLMFYKNSQFNETELLAKKAIELNKKNTDAYIVLGNIYLSKAIKSESDEEKKSLLKQSSINFGLAAMYNSALPEAYIGLAKVYYEQGKNSRALDELLKAQELDIYNPDTLFSIGEFYYNLANYQKSLRYLKKSADLKSKQDYQTHYLMASIYDKLGDSANAKKEYQLLLSINTNEEIKARLNEYDKEKPVTPDKEEQNVALKQVSSNLDLLSKADQHLLNDRYLEARDIYRQILQNNPEYTGAISGLLEMYYAQSLTGYFNGKYYLEDASFIEKAHSEKLIIPLIKFKLTGSQEPSAEVVKELESLAFNNSNDHTSMLNSARALFLLGDYKASKEKIDILLSSQISQAEIARIAKLLYLDHNYNEAERAIKILNTSDSSMNISFIKDRIKDKKAYAESIFQKGLHLHKKHQYQEALIKFEETIRYLPTHKKAHLYYAYALHQIKMHDNAEHEVKTYLKLEEAYPSSRPDLTPNKADKMLKVWEKEEKTGKTQSTKKRIIKWTIITGAGIFIISLF